MANQEHFALLRQGAYVWNEWRKKHPEIQPDLSEAVLTESVLIKNQSLLNQIRKLDSQKTDLSTIHAYLAQSRRTILSGADLSKADLHAADLEGIDLSEANLSEANLSEANLYGANLYGANLSKADLHAADLTGAILNTAHLSEANLSSADLHAADLTEATLYATNLSGADLTRVTLVETNLTKATLTGCYIYGISAWNVELKGAIQQSLVITLDNQPTITVDNLKIAQFVYLLLNNAEIREVIDTITSKVVLILGRFTPERKAVLDALKDELRKHNYTPVVFDFEKPASRDITETISTLAHLARFVVADITDAKSVPQELMAIVPNLPSVPVQPLILASQHEYGMFEHFTKFPWVLPVYRYRDERSLLQVLKEKVIAPAEQMAKELEKSLKRSRM